MTSLANAANRPAESKQLSPREIGDFLRDVGGARSLLKELHGYLKSIKDGTAKHDSKAIEVTVQSVTSQLQDRLGRWDRKPIFEGGIELRLQNEPCGLCAGKFSARILIEEIQSGKIGQALKDVEVSERTLTNIYRTLSGDASNPMMIKG